MTELSVMASSDKYRAILFDLDDTLISLRGCEALALEQTLSQSQLAAKLTADVSQVFAEISAEHWRQKADLRFTREQVVEYSLRDLLIHFKAGSGLAASLAEQYWTNFCNAAAFNPGAKTVLTRLAPAYRLGMITNGYIDSQRGRLDAAGLTRYFDPILISEEVGVAKPDVQIFEMALDQLDLCPEEVLYIGDSISHDREGCVKAGIDFCHYCPDQREGDLPAVKFRIGHLNELILILLSGAP